jgi:invasion protein IalB
MSQAFPSLERLRTNQGKLGQLMLGGRLGLALLAGVAVLLVAAAGGAYYIGTLSSSQAIQQSQTPAQAPTTSQQAPAQQAAPAIQWRTIGTFGSWEARCTTPPGQTAQLCTAVLQIINNQNKSVLMSWIVGPDEKGVLQAILQTPTGVMIANGVEIKVGNAAARKVSYQSCNTQQCTASGPMNDAFVKEITVAERANITLTAINGQALNFGIPVGGLDKALAAIKK